MSIENYLNLIDQNLNVTDASLNNRFNSGNQAGQSNQPNPQPVGPVQMMEEHKVTIDDLKSRLPTVRDVYRYLVDG